MASSSAASSGSAPLGIPQRCFHCKEMSEQLRPGWQLQDGNFAGLCYTCSSAYENGSFCGLNHLWLDGWRECKGCRNYIHCGCVMSARQCIIAETGGVLCTRCFRSLNFDQQTSVNPVLALDLNHPIFDSEDATTPPNCPGSQPLTSPLQEGIHTSNSLNFLFEKTLSATDSDPKSGRLILPKHAAEDHFGKLSKTCSVPMTFYDPDEKAWSFTYKRWSGSKQYVLEGLKDYMIEQKWQAGDKVKFYRKGPDGKILMAVYNTITSSSD